MDTKVIIKLFMALSFVLMMGGASADSAPTSFQAHETKYLVGEGRQQWLTQMRGSLLIVKRETGPFGLYQDLTVKREIKTEKPVVKNNVFPKAVNALKIDIIASNGKSFYIGFREIKKGQIFPLEYGENKFMVRVTSITKKEIAFENVDTGEKVMKRDKKIPDGMKAGGSNLGGIDGLTPENDKNPGSVIVPEK